jgi:outer membrane protein assembly factor BamA
VFEREVKLSELDPIVRYLMSTGGFSNVEVVDRETQSGAHELVLVANLLRKIKTITVTGNSVLSTSEIVAILNVSPGQPFERKDLLNAADELRQAYQVHGYQNTKVEIEFELPNENEVLIKTVISEGEPLRISELTIDCANPKLKSALTKLSSRDRNAILTEDLLNSLQKRLSEEMKDRHFLLARLSEPTFAYNPAHTQAKVSYSVESPWELSIDFVGNHYFSDGTIENLLASDKLSGATSSPAPDMAEKIRRMYQNAGFANVEVTSSETKEERTFKYRIQFKISESPRVAIDSFQVTGTLSRPQDYYAELLHTLSTGIIDKGFYNKAELEETSKRLITELQNQGYLRAKVQSTRSEYSKDKSKVTIYLALDEGPLTQVRQIRFDGADSFNDEQLKKIMTIKAGAALSLKDLETSIQSLKDFYSSQGFIEMRIANENERNKIVFYNDNQSQATIEFHIVEGPRVTVESIVLQGNGFTKDEVIRRELSFKKGDLLTPEKINDSIFHLQNLGLFSKVAIRTSEKGTMMAARTVIVEVEERDPGIFTLGFGINNERSLTFRGYLGLSYRNLNGTGRGLSFRGDPKYSTDPAISYIEQRIALGYTEPYLFEDHARGRVNVVRDVHFYGFDSATGQTIISNDNSIGLLIERELTRHTKLTFTRRKILAPNTHHNQRSKHW